MVAAHHRLQRRQLDATAARWCPTRAPTSVVIEWDEFDWCTPALRPHDLRRPQALRGICGAEHLSRITTTSPDGDGDRRRGPDRAVHRRRLPSLRLRRAEPWRRSSRSTSTTAWLRHRLPRLDPVRDRVEVLAVERLRAACPARPGPSTPRSTRDGERRPRGLRRPTRPRGGLVDPCRSHVEYGVYRRLRPTAVPVARALWFEDDPAWQPDGRPAYVRAKVEGDWRLPFLASPDPADDERRIEAAKEHLAKLAVVHTIDWRALGFDELFPVPDGPADVVPNLVRLFLAASRTCSTSRARCWPRGVEWLLATAPTAPCVTFCKGTNGHGEEVWRDGRIVAMSDWELACIAEPGVRPRPGAGDGADHRAGRPPHLGLARGAGLLRAVQRHPGHPRAGRPTTGASTPCRCSCSPITPAATSTRAATALARFAWTSTEMQYQAELRFAVAGGFAPGAPPDDAARRRRRAGLPDRHVRAVIARTSRRLRRQPLPHGGPGAAVGAGPRRPRGPGPATTTTPSCGSCSNGCGPTSMRRRSARSRPLSPKGPRPGGYVAVTELQREALVLRQALVACIEVLPDRDAPARAAIRRYLTHQLERQRPWLVDAFTGPRR